MGEVTCIPPVDVLSDRPATRSLRLPDRLRRARSLRGRTSPSASSSPVAPAASPTSARWLAERLSPALGQSVVVENRTGAGGNLGTVGRCAACRTATRCLIVHIGTMTINPHIYPNPGYDPLTDIAPITRLGVGPQALAVHKNVPARSVEEVAPLLRRAQAGRSHLRDAGRRARRAILRRAC